MFKNNYSFLGRWELRHNKKPLRLRKRFFIIYSGWLGLACRSEVQGNLRLLSILNLAVSQLISVNIFV